MKDALQVIGAMVGIVLFIYFMYWVTKTGSYVFFYEGMVQETIREMVKPEYLLR